MVAIRKMNNATNAKITETNAKIDAKIDAKIGETNAKIDEMHAKVDELKELLRDLMDAGPREVVVAQEVQVQELPQ